MTEHVKLTMGRPLAGVRSHGPVDEARNTEARGSRWLFGVRERARREAERDAALDACLRTMQDCLDAVTDSVNRRLDEIAALATELGLALAREVLGAAIDRGLADPTPAVQRCLRVCAAGAGSGQLTVCLAPDDLGPVLDRLDTHLELRERLVGIRFVGDPQLERGSVRVESESGQLLYEPSEVLQRVCDEVRKELAE